MGNLTACIAKMGKSLNDTDRRDIMERYGAHMKDGMPASDAGELAIREVHGELVNELNDIIKSASQVGVRISMSEPIVAKTDTVAKTADQSEEARLASLSPFEFAAEVLQVLGSAQDVYRAPKIPKTVTTVDAAVAIGIPGATKTGFKSEEDFTAGFNTPEANTSDNAFDVAEQVRYGETTFALPVNPRTGNPGGEFKVKIYEPSKNFPSGAIEVDVSLVGSGNSGAVVYNMAAGLAAATGRSFRADSASMSEWGALRRTVSMTNAAMRYGVQFVEPGEPQMRPGSKVASVGVAPLDWEPRGLGKTVGNNEGAEPRAAANFGNLLRSEARSVRQVVGNVIESYSFDWQTKGFTKDGKPVSFAEGSSDIVELVNRGEANAKAKGLTPYNPLAKAGGAESTKAAPPYGRASIARAVLVQSLARMDGGAGRRAILDGARQLISPGPVVAQADGTDPATTPETPASNVPADLRRLWSQGERPVDALKSKDRAVTVLRAAWGAAFTRMYGDGRIKVVSQAEAVGLLGGVAGADTAKGWFDPATGTAYVVWDNNTRDEIAGTMLHEAGVHLAAPEMLGSDLYNALVDSLMTRARSGKDAKAAAALAAAQAALVDANGNRIASDASVRHETLAYFAETNPGDGLVIRAVDAFKSILNRLGFRLTRLESDNALLLRVMRDALRVQARGYAGNAPPYQGGEMYANAPLSENSDGPDEERQRATEPAADRAARAVKEFDDVPAMFSQRTPAQKELMRKAGMPIETRSLMARTRDAVLAEWDVMRASWHEGTDARIQAIADRFRGVSAAEEAIERMIGRKLELNERSYVMMRMNLGLPAIMDAVLQYGAPRYEDQTWTQWAEVTDAAGVKTEVHMDAPSRRDALDRLAAAYPGGVVNPLRKPKVAVPGLAEKTGMSGGTHGVFVRNTQTKGLLEAFKPVAGDLNGFLAWMAVQRAKKTMAEERENNFNADDIAAGDAIPDTPEKLAAFKQAAKDYEAIKTAILDMAEQAGVISREGREAWDHAEYLPFFRQLTAGTLGKMGVLGPRTSKRMTDNRPGIRRLTGGEGVLADPLGNIVRNFTKLIDSSMKNTALARLVTNLSLNVDDVDGIRNRLANLPSVEASQIERAFAKVGLYDAATGAFTAGSAEFSRADLRAALRAAGVGSEQIMKAMGTADADSVFFDKLNMEVTRALIPMSAVIRQLKEDGVSDTVIDMMPPSALQGMREMMAFETAKGPDVFTVLTNGKAQAYRAVDPLLVRSLVGMQPRERSWVTAQMSGFARFLTGMITRDPVFMVRNLTRDVLQNWVISDVPYEPIFSTVRGVTRSMMETGGAIDMMFAGASFHRGHVQVHDPDATALAVRRKFRQSGMSRSDEDAAVKRFTDSILDFGRNGLEMWDRVGSSVENATREAMFEAALRAGLSKAEASFMARDVMDFGLRGDSGIINWLADVLPFFNARIQGAYKLYRAGAVPGMGPKMRGAVMMRGMALVGFSAGLMAMNMTLFAAGYEGLEEWEKDTYWHLAPGTIYHQRIPKPFEIGLLFGTLPERLIAATIGAATGYEEGDTPRKSLGAVWGGLWNTMGMNPIPQMVLPVAELYANKSMFTGRPIENMGDMKIPKAQVGEFYTSPIAKAAAGGLSDVLMAVGFGPRAGLSSKQIEHLWRGYTGTIGVYALSVADILVNRLSGSPTSADDFTDWALSVAPADIPLIPGRSTRPIADIIKNGDWRDGGTPRNFRQASEFYALQDNITVIASGIKAQMEASQTAFENGEPEMGLAAIEDAREDYKDSAGLLGATVAARTKTGKVDKRVRGGLRFTNQTAMNAAVAKLRVSRDSIEAVMTNSRLSAVEQKRQVATISAERKRIIEAMIEQIRTSKAEPPEGGL